MTTALDALCHNLKAVILEDCSAAVSEDIHQATLDIYRRTALYPLFKVRTSDEFLNEIQ